MSGPGQEFVELFLQEASEHLQFLREYSGVLLDPYPAARGHRAPLYRRARAGWNRRDV